MNETIADESTAATSGNRINNDHIVVPMPDSLSLAFSSFSVSNPGNSSLAFSSTSVQGRSAGSDSFSIPALPPLSLISTPQNQERRTKRAFELNNTIRVDSIEAKKQRSGQVGHLIHPTKIERFKRLLNQTNIRRIPEGQDEVDFRQQMVEYLNDKVGAFCYSQRQCQSTKCTCLKELCDGQDDNIDIVADIVTSYYGLVYNERHSILSNKIHSMMDLKVSPKLKSVKNMKFRGRIFNIRGKFNNDDSHDNTYSHPLCLCGFNCIYGYGSYEIDTIKGKYDQSTFGTERNISHGLMGKASNNSVKEDILLSLHDYFKKDLKEEGDDYASRQVRTALGVSYLRDNELEGVRLPPFFTKRIIYERWCYSRGWVVPRGLQTDKTYKLYTKRQVNDDEWPEGSESLPICSRSKFMSFWKQEYPTIKIAAQAKDTCATCWEFKRQIVTQDKDRLLSSNGDELETTIPNDDNNVTPDQEDESPNEGMERSELDDIIEYNLFDEQSHNDNDTLSDGMVSNNNSSGVVPLYSLTNSSSSTSPNVSNSNHRSNVHDSISEPMEQEETVSQWKHHCDSYRSQRQYVQYLSKQASDDLSQGVQWPNRKYCFCADYCQNMDLPHFGQEQPGETYYYSPLNISCFGCCDFATDILDAFVYNEGEGRKGGNNVCSLLYKKLQDDGIIQLSKDKGPGAQLSLVFDNCAGQNKNRMVLRLGQYLIDAGIFRRIEIIFLIMGHTKNICDRRFKDLKNRFHHRNVYTMEQLIKTLSDGNENVVKVVHVNRNHFFNWDKFFTNNLNYKKAIKDCSKFHCFYYDHIQAGIIHKQHNRLDISSTKETVNKNTNNLIWKQSLKDLCPTQEKAPEISDIKQVELYTKWRKLLPDQFQEDTCPKPTAEILNKVKKDKAKKAKDKLAAKKARGATLNEQPGIQGNTNNE